MSVKEFALRTFAYRVQSERNVLQIFGSIKAFSFRVICFKFSLNQLVKIRENGVISRFHRAPIRVVGYPEFLVELYQKQLNCVNLTVGKILVAAEEVAQKADVLRQLGLGLERPWSVIICGFIAPRFRFEYIYNILARHQIDKTTTEIFCQVDILHFGIKTNNIFSALA